jgi:hypothetical protein
MVNTVKTTIFKWTPDGMCICQDGEKVTDGYVSVIDVERLLGEAHDRGVAQGRRGSAHRDAEIKEL